MATRDVQVKITSQFEDRGFKSAEQSAKALERELNKAEQSQRRMATMQMQAAREMAAAEQAAAQQRVQAINTVANAVGVLGLAMTAFAGLAVAKWAQFDAAMSEVAATGDDARGSLDALKDAALDAGQATAFSATEAAGAIENLAKAGMSAEDILGGGLAGALDLAAAGGLEVATAAEIAAIAMAQFGLSGEDVAHVADLLAAGAGKANGSVEDMGMALKQAGLIASQTGLTIEETTATLAAFAEAGLLGSDAGTSLKTMLQRLSNPAGEAAAEMERLGISAYDASGQFVGMEALAGQLRAGLESLTPAQRNAALAIIFGADATRAASVLYEQGADGIATWTAAVNDQGYAAEAAAARMDNLKGDLEQLSGAFETWMIRLGESGDAPLRGVVQGVTDVVTALGDMPAAAQAAVLAIAGGGGLALLGAAGVVKLTTALGEAKVAMDTLGWSAKGVSLATAGIAGVIGLAAAALMNFSQAQAEARQRVDEYTSSLDAQTGAITGNTRALAAKRLEEAGALASAQLLGIEAGRLVDAIMGEADALNEVNAALDGYVLSMDEGAGVREEQRNAINDVQAALGRESESLEEARASAERQQEAVEGATSAHEAATGAIQDQTAAIESLIEALDALNGANLSLIEAQIAYEAAVDSVTASLEENGATLDLNTEAGRANMETLTGLARDAAAVAAATLEATGSQEQFQGSLAVSRQALAEAAMSMGMSEAAAWAFVDSVLAIPPAASTTVTAPGAAEATSQVNALGNAVRNLPSYKEVVINNVIRTTYQGTPLSGTGGIGTLVKADGGLVDFYGSGGVREDHSAQIAPAGAWRVWAEPETGGEAYIPLAPSKRARSESILEDVADRFGMRVERYGSGGIRGGGAVSAGDLRAALDGATLHLGRIDPITGAVKAQLRLEQQRRAGI